MWGVKQGCWGRDHITGLSLKSDDSTPLGPASFGNLLHTAGGLHITGTPAPKLVLVRDMQQNPQSEEEERPRLSEGCLEGDDTRS